jgi:hypothetical protein
MKLAFIVLSLAQVFSCSVITQSEMTRNYSKALDHGLATIPVARQFQELFPGSHNSYAYYAGVKNTPELQCQTLLYGRYELTLQIEVKFDDQRTKVVSYGDPAFSLEEIESVTFFDDGRVGIRNGDLHHRFGAKEWGQVYQAHGEFSALGLKPVKDKPVPNLEAWWKKEGEKF